MKKRIQKLIALGLTAAMLTTGSIAVFAEEAPEITDIIDTVEFQEEAFSGFEISDTEGFEEENIFVDTDNDQETYEDLDESIDTDELFEDIDAAFVEDLFEEEDENTSSLEEIEEETEEDTDGTGLIEIENEPEASVSTGLIEVVNGSKASGSTVASSDISNKIINESKKNVQSMINGFLDMCAKENAALLPLMGPLKLIIGEMFGMNNSTDPNKVILEKLNEIEKHLDVMEDRLKEHMENVVALDSIGGEFQKVANAIIPIKNKIGDITDLYKAGKISESEKDHRIALLYSSPEYNTLTQALAGATNAYAGNTSYTLDQRSIFGAAYNLQCNSVMFSGEAIDCVTPYLLRQLCTYLKGYALINTVLDSYEEINGADAAMSTREDMFANLGGYMNGEFDPKHPGVFGLYHEFFKTSRFIFVNKSSNKAHHVNLSNELYATFYFSQTYIVKALDDSAKLKEYTPPCMSQFPLNANQMKDLASYAANKKTALYPFLADVVGFELKIAPNFHLWLLTGNMFAGSLTPETTITLPVLVTMTLEQIIRSSATTYMPTGNQYITGKREICFGYCEAPVYNYIQAINANKVGAGDEKLTVAYNYDKNYESTAVNPNMLFFVNA